MKTFNSGREAKEFLIDRIVAEAKREEIPLSEIERKMMYFTETAWTLPDIWLVNDVFVREYDQSSYETKIARIAQKARACAKDADELDDWKEAIQILKLEDHYLSVLLTATSKLPDSALVNQLKLVGTALLICLLDVAAILLFSAKR